MTITQWCGSWLRLPHRPG